MSFELNLQITLLRAAKFFSDTNEKCKKLQLLSNKIKQSPPKYEKINSHGVVTQIVMKGIHSSIIIMFVLETRRFPCYQSELSYF